MYEMSVASVNAFRIMTYHVLHVERLVRSPRSLPDVRRCSDSSALRPAMRARGIAAGHDRMKMKKTRKSDQEPWSARIIPITRSADEDHAAVTAIDASPSTLGPRVERVTQPVADDVEREHRQRPALCRGRARATGRSRCSSWPSTMRLPQDGLRRRHAPAAEERGAASVRMLLAMISVNRTSSDDAMLGTQLTEHDAPRAALPWEGRGLDELLLAQREDLSAQQPPAHVGNQHVRDHERRDPDARGAAVDLDAGHRVVEAVDATAPCPGAIASRITGNAQIQVEEARDDDPGRARRRR